MILAGIGELTALGAGPGETLGLGGGVTTLAAGGGVTVGPILLGADKSAHILTQTATVRGILNMTALAVVDAAQTSARALPRMAAE